MPLSWVFLSMENPRGVMARSSLDRQLQEPALSPAPNTVPLTLNNSAKARAGAFGGAVDNALWLELVILPDQFATDRRSVVQRTGEYRLLVAILQDALATWFRCRPASRSRESRLFQEVSAWFAEKRSNWPFAFERICDYLGLDPDYIRRGLVQWRPAVPGQRCPQFQMTPAIRNRERIAYDESSRRSPFH